MPLINYNQGCGLAKFSAESESKATEAESKSESKIFQPSPNPSLSPKFFQPSPSPQRVAGFSQYILDVLWSCNDFCSFVRENLNKKLPLINY